MVGSPGGGFSRAVRQWLLLILLAAGTAGCSTLMARTPLPEDQLGQPAPYGIEGPIRYWGDSVSDAASAEILAERIEHLRVTRASEIASKKPIRETAIAFSGGGADGAFGAGLMNGWSARGDRPRFDVVTGVSTGAIVALLTFLGPEYDSRLQEFYTRYSTEDLLSPSPFALLGASAGMSDASGYRGLIDAFIDDTVVARLAEASGAGRVLLIGTTNLDASRPVIWDVTKVAASGHPETKRLIGDIIQASSAVPAVMPPVVVPVTSPDGRQFDELHVDGGATQQVMLFSPKFSIRKIDRAVGTRFDRRLYVVINNSLEKPYEPVELGVLPIAGRAVSSIIGGSGTGDVYKLHTIAQRDNIDFNVVWVPQSFEMESEEPFDRAYMNALYDLGFAYGQAGNAWSKYPPNYSPR